MKLRELLARLKCCDPESEVGIRYREDSTSEKFTHYVNIVVAIEGDNRIALEI